jgi:hypothetical protein
VVATIDVAGTLLAVGAFVALRRFQLGLIPVISVSATLGAAWYLVA